MSLSTAASGVAQIPLALCRSCKAQIFWAKTPANKAMPLDALPIDTGKFVVCSVSPPRVATFDPHLPGHARLARFQSHYASCPDGERWRRRSR